MPEVANGKSEYYTGEKNKSLLVHVLQNGVEVDKPIKSQIWHQSVEWKRRIYPIDSTRFIVDSKGQHHQYVSANDVAVLSVQKDHEDRCKKCGGKMTVDARNLRDLVKRKTIEPIWGIDTSHIVLLMILAIVVLAMVGMAFYMYTEKEKLQTKINSAIATNNVKPLTAEFMIPAIGLIT